MDKDRVVALCLLVGLVGMASGFGGGVYWVSQVNFKDAVALSYKKDDLLPDYQKALEVANYVLASMSAELADTRNNLPEKINDRVSGSEKEVTYLNPNADFTGEDLWRAVNQYRKEVGVPELQLHSDLCQMSSFRLGELLDSGKLDNHAGFEKYFENHSVGEMGLTNVAENLASGYDTAEELVKGWDSSPPHRTFLLADGSYIYGCTSANLGFGVLIGGY